MKDSQKFNIEVSGGGKQILIFDEQVDSLICRISFYDEYRLSRMSWRHPDSMLKLERYTRRRVKEFSYLAYVIEPR
jgi:hypothetical protein